MGYLFFQDIHWTRIVINIFILSRCKKDGDMDRIVSNEPTIPLVYNYVSSVENPITWKDFMSLCTYEGFKVR